MLCHKRALHLILHVYISSPVYAALVILTQMIGCLSPIETYIRVNRKIGFVLLLILLEHICFIDRLILALKCPYSSLGINLFISKYRLCLLRNLIRLEPLMYLTLEQQSR